MEQKIKDHIKLRSQMFRLASHDKTYEVTRRLEELIGTIYGSLLCDADNVIDIGAHIGYHTRQFSDLIGDSGFVLAVEPNVDLKARFESYVGPRKNVILIHEVLSDSQKQTYFYCVSGQKSSRSSLILWDREIKESEFQKQEVRTSTIDLINNFKSLKFIKIDAEGADLNCLKGGLRTIEQLRPYIVLEWNETSFSSHGHRSEDLVDFSNSANYRIFNTFGDELSNPRLFGIYSSKFGDFFLVPSERVNQFLEKTGDAVRSALDRYETEIVRRSA
jgi:FkbM family methyltransferase